MAFEITIEKEVNEGLARRGRIKPRRLCCGMADGSTEGAVASSACKIYSSPGTASCVSQLATIFLPGSYSNCQTPHKKAA
jgi:hypothetical protein